MDKYLITGFSGFVSSHFLDLLEMKNERADVPGVDMLAPPFSISGFKNIRCSFEQCDLLDKSQVDNIIYQFQPNYILHLASFSSVAYSWKEPVSSFNNNNNVFLNILEMVRCLQLKCRVLSVGSSEEYGIVPESDLPVTEGYRLAPASPYAVARVSQEMLSRVYEAGYGLDIVMTRSFNHIGPRQRDNFVVSSYARQFVTTKKTGKRKLILKTGDTSITRDFLDVRDVVAAYHLLFKRGKKGEIYNVCSGEGRSLLSVIELISGILDIETDTVLDPWFVRPKDNPKIIGCNTKLREDTGWSMQYSFEESLKDILVYWDEVNGV